MDKWPNREQLMRAVLLGADGMERLGDIPDPTPAPGEVVLRPAYCGLCGTDLELLAGVVDPAFVRYPLVLGHEWSGVVEAVGAGVTYLEPGMRCVAEGIIPCGNCPPINQFHRCLRSGQVAAGMR